MNAPFPADQPIQHASDADAILLWLTGDVEVSTRADWLRTFSERRPAASELVRLIQALRQRMIPVELHGQRLRGPLIDVCGTGGDRAGLFNISTATAFVAAGAGAVVAKHGNRAITSSSGTADALEALGIAIEQTPEHAADALETKRFAFLFAPAFHPAFKSIGPVRKHLAEQGVPTVFNLFGPLLNPARPRRQLIGVHDPGKAALVAEICAQMDYAKVWVVSGQTTESGGFIDELSLSGPTRVHQVQQGQVEEFTVDPEKLGFTRTDVNNLKGSEAASNASLIQRILSGEESGPKTDIVILNAAAALLVSGIVEDLEEGVQRARSSILCGSAQSVLDSVRRVAGNN